MILILIINDHGKLYRVYYDSKYDDYVILTPKFRTTRYLPHCHFDKETNIAVKDRIEEVRNLVKEGREIKAITISIRR